MNRDDMARMWNEMNERARARRVSQAQNLKPRKMSILEAYAHHGSISYGVITAERLGAVLLGSEPTEAEIPCIRQALLESSIDAACDLAVEMGIPFQDLEARARELCGEELGASCLRL